MTTFSLLLLFPNAIVFINNYHEFLLFAFLVMKHQKFHIHYHFFIHFLHRKYPVIVQSVKLPSIHIRYLLCLNREIVRQVEVHIRSTLSSIYSLLYKFPVPHPESHELPLHRDFYRIFNTRDKSES